MVRFFHRGSRPLSAMANNAAKLVQSVWDRRMFSEWLRARAHQRAIHVHVAAFTAIYNAESCYPCLAHAAMKALHQRSALPLAGKLQVRLLVMPPVTEIVLGRGNRQEASKATLTRPNIATSRSDGRLRNGPGLFSSVTSFSEYQ